MRTWIQGTPVLKLLMLGPSVVTPFPLWPDANTFTGSVWHSLLFSLSCVSILDGSSFPLVSFLSSLLSHPAPNSILPRKESEGVHLKDGSGGHSSHRASMCESLEALQFVSRARCCHSWLISRASQPNLCYVKTSPPEVKVRRKEWMKDSEPCLSMAAFCTLVWNTVEWTLSLSPFFMGLTWFYSIHPFVPISSLMF